MRFFFVLVSIVAFVVGLVWVLNHLVGRQWSALTGAGYLVACIAAGWTFSALAQKWWPR